MVQGKQKQRKSRQHHAPTLDPLTQSINTRRSLQKWQMARGRRHVEGYLGPVEHADTVCVVYDRMSTLFQEMANHSHSSVDQQSEPMETTFGPTDRATLLPSIKCNLLQPSSSKLPSDPHALHNNCTPASRHRMVWCCDRHIGLDASNKYGIILVYPRIDRVDRIATTREDLTS